MREMIWGLDRLLQQRGRWMESIVTWGPRWKFWGKMREMSISAQWHMAYKTRKSAMTWKLYRGWCILKQNSFLVNKKWMKHQRRDWGWAMRPKGHSGRKAFRVEDQNVGVKGWPGRLVFSTANDRKALKGKWDWSCGSHSRLWR